MPKRGVYAHPLPAPIEIDGYTSDWSYHLSGLEPAVSKGNTARYVAGKHAGYLYLLFLVEDDDVVYRDPQTPVPRDSDRVRLVLTSAAGERRAFGLSPISPGRVSAYQIPERNDPGPIKIELRILAAWQANPTGYRLELRLPLVCWANVSDLMCWTSTAVTGREKTVGSSCREPAASSCHRGKSKTSLPVWAACRAAECGCSIGYAGYWRARGVWSVKSRWLPLIRCTDCFYCHRRMRSFRIHRWYPI